MENIKEYDLGYARVRVHPSKMSAEEQRKVYEDAAKRLLRAVQKAHKNKAV